MQHMADAYFNITLIIIINFNAFIKKLLMSQITDYQLCFLAIPVIDVVHIEYSNVHDVSHKHKKKTISADNAC